MLLALTAWVGALVFFPLVAATAFGVLPTAHMAGVVVRESLVKLHWIGFACGSAFLVCSLAYNRTMVGRIHSFAFSHVLIILMVALTAISQFHIIPKMEALRISAGEINLLTPNDPVRAQFELLHVWSTRVEGSVLVLGIVLLVLTAKRLATTRP